MSTIPVQRTYAVGEQLTAANLNLLSSGVNWWNTSRPVMIGWGTTVISLANQTWTTIPINNKSQDTDSAFSTTTYTYTAQTSGWYLVVGGVGFAASTSRSRAARFLVNGNPVAGVAAVKASGFSCCVPFQRDLYLGLGDTLVLQGFQDSGGALNCNPATGGNGSETSSLALVYTGN